LFFFSQRQFQELQNIPNISTIGIATEERTAEPARRLELSKGPQAEIHVMQDRFNKEIQDTTANNLNVDMIHVDLFQDTYMPIPGGDDFPIPDLPQQAETDADRDRLAAMATTIIQEDVETAVEQPQEQGDGVQGIGKTLSNEINKMTEQQVKKYARAAQTKKGVKRHLIGNFSYLFYF
jgi:hypothetical protein